MYFWILYIIFAAWSVILDTSLILLCTLYWNSTFSDRRRATQVAYQYYLTVSPADGHLYVSDPEKHQILRVISLEPVQDPSINSEAVSVIIVLQSKRSQYSHLTQSNEFQTFAKCRFCSKYFSTRHHIVNTRYVVILIHTIQLCFTPFRSKYRKNDNMKVRLTHQWNTCCGVASNARAQSGVHTRVAVRVKIWKRRPDIEGVLNSTANLICGKNRDLWRYLKRVCHSFRHFEFSPLFLKSGVLGIHHSVAEY